MNNQEAIEHLKNIMIFSYQDGYTAEAREALDMAIKALQAQELNCDGCVYQEVTDRFVDPCIRCKRNCIDYWKEEE